MPNEDMYVERLEALDAYNIMDTEPEPEFDDIVLVASALCHTPVALISLIEKDRQWFKARVGFETSDTPIEQAICAHALGGSDVLVIPDLQLDQRTRQNMFVTGEPQIRFYAGAPLITPDDVVIGTLCVIDVEPRPQGLEEGQKAALQALARQVIALLEMRRISQRKDDLFRRQKSISANIRSSVNANLAAQEAGRVGTFEIDIDTSMIKVSRELCRIFHVPIAETYPARAFEEMVLPQDRELQSSDTTRREGSAPLDVEYRIRVPGYGVRWIARNASFRHDEAGRPVKMIGTVRDVTAAKREAARVQALLDLGDRLRDLSDMESMAIAAGDLMAKALDATRAGFGIVNAADETVVVPADWCAPGVKSLAGLHHFRDYGSFIDDLKRGETVIVADVATDPRTRGHAGVLLALGIRVLVNVPIYELGHFRLIAFIHHDQPYLWSEEEIAFVRSFGNRIQIAMSRVEAEQEQQMLNREMSHRLKNTLSMVQAIASQTLRPVAERDLVEAFEKRLHALSTAHDILFEQNWTSAAVSAVVDRTMEGLGVGDRIDAEGPNVRFGPKGSLSLSLLIHELTTNAMKYGALSNDSGRVAIEWRIEGTGPDAVFHLSWRETGGPVPRAPERRGFGSKLIRMGLIGTGGVLVSYDQPGFSAEMTAVLLQLARTD